MATSKSTEPDQPDLVFVRDLSVRAVTGVDAWHRPRPQPVSISVFFKSSVARAGTTDHLSYSLNYDVISRHISKVIENGKFKTLEEIADKVSEAALNEDVGGVWAKVHVRKPRALLRADSAEIVITRERIAKKTQTETKTKANSAKYDIVKVAGTVDKVLINQMQLVTIIGVNNIERLHRQNIMIDLTLYKPDNVGSGFFKEYNFRDVAKKVEEHVENSSYKTVEAFVTSVAEVVCRNGVDRVTVRAEKPSAITFANAAGVEITRSRDFFEGGLPSEPLSSPTVSISSGNSGPVQQPTGENSNFPLFPDSGFIGNGEHETYIAFGSNVGDTLENIVKAKELLNSKGVQVVSTSSLYESWPMYVTDQQKFLNGVFKASTNLQPFELLSVIKDIEYKELNRVKKLENGPRSIDLDILLYDDLVMNHPQLKIPHMSMLSRSFVLKPLSELVPSTKLHPITAEPYHAYLDQIPDASNDQVSSKLFTKVPLPHSKSKALTFDPQHKCTATAVMAILNVTPDSFSDGGQTDSSNIVEKALSFVSAGATILDIGGMSTNPKAKDPGAGPELARVLPAVKLLRACKDLDHIPLSIDTYRASVADACLSAGADIINDISGGLLDDDMFSVAVKHGAPIILNHSRGTPETMNNYATYSLGDSSANVEDDSDEAVIQCVANELETMVHKAMAAGVPRWQIILDPGLGFAKNLSHNMAIIKNLSKLINSKESFTGLAWLLGPSRKRFIGTITDEPDASKRVWGTAAVITANIAQGADIVRVHDVAEISKVTKMADAIYKQVQHV